MNLQEIKLRIKIIHKEEGEFSSINKKNLFTLLILWQRDKLKVIITINVSEFQNTNISILIFIKSRFLHIIALTSNWAHQIDLILHKNAKSLFLLFFLFFCFSEFYSYCSAQQLPLTVMFFLRAGMVLDQSGSYYSPQVSVTVPSPIEVAV